MFNKSHIHVQMFIMIFLIVSTPLFCQSSSSKIHIDKSTDKMLVLNNGDYYTGKLVHIFKEGVYFDPNMELNFDNPPPALYPFSTILHIREMDGRTYTVKMLEAMAENSIREYNSLLPDPELTKYQKKYFHSFANLEIGSGSNTLQDTRINAYEGYMDYTQGGNPIDWAIDLNYLITYNLGIGARFDQKRYNIDYQFTPYENEEETNYITPRIEFLQISHVSIIAPFGPFIFARYDIGKILFSLKLIYSPVIIHESEKNGDSMSKTSGTMYGEALGIDYILSDKWSLGVAANFYQYTFSGVLPGYLNGYDDLSTQDIRGSLKYYFDW